MTPLNPRQWLIRLYMTQAGAYEQPHDQHLRVGRGRLDSHEARVAAACIAADLIYGAPLDPNPLNGNLQWH
jgi:hypothetical protein